MSASGNAFKQSLTGKVKVGMTELLVIGSSCFLGSPLGILQLARKKCKAKDCFDVLKTILQRDYPFFAAVLSEMDLGNIYGREA